MFPKRELLAWNNPGLVHDLGEEKEERMSPFAPRKYPLRRRLREFSRKSSTQHNEEQWQAGQCTGRTACDSMAEDAASGSLHSAQYILVGTRSPRRSGRDDSPSVNFEKDGYQAQSGNRGIENRWNRRFSITNCKLLDYKSSTFGSPDPQPVCSRYRSLPFGKLRVGIQNKTTSFLCTARRSRRCRGSSSHRGNRWLASGTTFAVAEGISRLTRAGSRTGRARPK